MSSRLNRADFKEWYGAPDQELFRREWAWTIAWLKRPLSVFLMLVYGLCSLPMYGMLFLSYYMVAISQNRKSSFDLPPYLMLIPLAYLGMLLGMLIHLRLWHRAFSLRVFPWMKSHRIRDIMVTPLDVHQLWPALLVAPLSLSITLRLIQLAMTISATAIYTVLAYSPLGENWIKPFELLEVAHRSQWPTLPTGTLFGVISVALTYAEGFVVAFLSVFVVTTFTAMKIRPFRSDSMFWIHAFLGYMAAVLPGSALSVIQSFLMPLVGLARIPALPLAALFFLMRIGIVILIARICWTQLRSRYHWETLRLKLENPKL